jgi:hypothetical protein
MASESTYTRFKHWLAANEIVFKTFAATLLSVMAVVVSIAQSETARQQLKVSNLQARIARANASPNFDISITQNADPAGYYGQWEMVLSNSGGPVHEVAAEEMHVLHAEAQPVRGTGLSVEADIPINGFYEVQFVSSASKGELSRFTGKDNERNLAAAERATISLAKSKGWVYLNFDERSFVHLHYRDLLEKCTTNTSGWTP